MLDLVNRILVLGSLFLLFSSIVFANGLEGLDPLFLGLVLSNQVDVVQCLHKVVFLLSQLLLEVGLFGQHRLSSLSHLGFPVTCHFLDLVLSLLLVLSANRDQLDLLGLHLSLRLHAFPMDVSKGILGLIQLVQTICILLLL